MRLKHTKIGVVGVGRMGSNMARRLKDQGFPVTVVYDAYKQSALAVAKELDTESASTLSRVTQLADVIITVVTDDAAMHKIYTSKRDHLFQGSRGKLFINCATISPKVHIEIQKLAVKNRAQTLEACMASSITQARQGTLYLMCGGSRQAYESARPILQALSSSPQYIGKTGDAAKVKALVNMVMNINTAGLAEGLGLGQALGLDLTVLRKIFSQTGANSRVLETDGADMQNREHDCYFSAAHAAKDSGIALDLAKPFRLNLPLAKATKQQYKRMIQVGFGELDKSGIAELTFPGRGKKKKASRK